MYFLYISTASYSLKCRELKWVKAPYHPSPFTVLSDKVLYSFMFSSWTQLFILLMVIILPSRWVLTLHKTEKMMATVEDHIGPFINAKYFENLRSKNSFQCNVSKAFCQIFTFFSVLVQSPTAVSWMGNTKLLGISTTTIKASSLLQ